MRAVRLDSRAWIAVGVATGAVAVFAVTLHGGLLGGGDTPVATASSSGPSSTTDPSLSPSGEPSSSLEPQILTRESSIDDATALARMANPRTGETWHAPVRAPQYDALFPESWNGPTSAFTVGERAGFDIAIGLGGIWPEWYRTIEGPLGAVTVGLWEIHDGVAYVVTCPSARSTDPCRPGRSYGEDISWLYLDDVFYDSLTYPASTDLDGGLTGHLSAGPGDAGGYPGYYPLQALDILAAFEPDAFAPFAAPTTSTVSTLAGGSAVVRVEIPSNISGVTNAFYGYRPPFGGAFYLDPNESLYEYGAPVVSGLEWAPTATPPTTLPITDGSFSAIPAAGYQCDSGMVYSIDHTHDSSEWKKVATDNVGRDIFAPVAGGNRVALAVYTRMQDLRGWEPGADLYAAHRPRSGASGVRTEPTDPYPFGTYEEFVAQYGVLTFEIAPGVWALVARAMADIYECA